MVRIGEHRYLTAKEYAAVLFGVVPDDAGEVVRRVYHLLERDKVEGAIKAGGNWLVPIETARYEVEAAARLWWAMWTALEGLEGEVTE